MQTERRVGVACVAALAALIVWVHSPGLTGSARLTAHHDNLDGAAPLRVEAARQWREEGLPLWNPWKRAGMPLLADTTAGAFYPGNAPFLFMDTEGADADSAVFRALDRVAAINALLGGLFMYVFLRAISLTPPAASFGGLVFACGGTMVWFAAWYIQIQSSAVWLPLILAAIHRASGAGTAWWTTVGGAAVALQFFAGFPETSFYSGVLAIAYSLHLAFVRGSLRPVASASAVYAVGLLLAAVQLLPSLELQSLSRRPGVLPLDVFQSLPATIGMFASWAIPSGPAGFEFPPLAAYYVGGVATVAAVAGAIGSLRQSAFFVAVLAVGVVLSLGAATPVNAWLHALPVFSAFRHPFKHLFEVSFALAVLAAFGMQLLAGRRDGHVSPLRTGAALLATVVTAVLLRTSTGVIAAANPGGVDTSGAKPSAAARIEPGWRVLTPRQVFQKRDPELLIGDFPSQFGIAALHGAGPFLWSPLAEATGMIEEETSFRQGLFGSKDRTLALLSSRYLIQTRQKNRFAPDADPSAWTVAGETVGGRILERRDALARLRFVGSVRCASEDEIRASLSGAGEDPASVALLDCAARPAPGGPFHTPASLSATIAAEEAGALVLETNVPEGAGAFLVVSQSDFPGWHAAVDGRRAPVHRVHGLVQGIELPPGSRRVEMRYMPLPFLVGAALSGSTLVVLLLWCVVARRDGDG
jgi:hypothetical protein